MGLRGDKINAMGDIGVIPCANQLGSHTNMGGFADNLRDVTTNLVAIGLGAQGGVDLESVPEVPSGTLDWIRQIVDHASSDKPNIIVRGDFTLNVLEHYGFGDSAVSLGCPSLLINRSRSLGELLQERYKAPYRKVAICAGHPNWTSMSALESSLVRIMEDTQGAYIIQSTDELIALSRNDFEYVSPGYKEKLRRYLKLNLDKQQLDD